MLEGIEFRRERLAAAATDEMIAAVDVADMLVKRGVPFRQSHGIVAGLVRDGGRVGPRRCRELSLEELARALRRARRGVLRGAIPGVVARVQGERGRDRRWRGCASSSPTRGRRWTRRPRRRRSTTGRCSRSHRTCSGCVVSFGGCSGVIVETEAYHFSEPACHAYVGVTPRTARAVRAAGDRLRLPLLRDPRAAERGLRARGRRRGGADPRAGAAARARRDARAPRRRPSSATARASSPRRWGSS